ncbi:PPOX class probable F420-dependent enzyme [Antricoccus suffuscus]|uniref:PPOX class probable F420-dependent enzyme n=1 Tax=Antricoccus suffuscus TaxID=1629062 RepID=A0A2T1A2H8_9ACTN|nr:TIGR03618 family F420-dependent PPOX class oxidoreductase [Antricoccus suffuscus]PRZ42805.1 PPOX class probable F420-dependent enzyme [Antricoccus suffuscus]
MTTVAEFADLAQAEQGLVVVATQRADRSVQASLVNAGVLDHPRTGEPVVGFVTYGRVKLANLRARPQLAVTVRSGWQWATVEGDAELIGPEDPVPGMDAERIRLLLREVFVAAGGQHDDWNEYDRVMTEQRRCVVLVRPTRCYSNAPTS